MSPKTALQTLRAYPVRWPPAAARPRLGQHHRRCHVV